MDPIQLPSGALLEAKPASFRDSNTLLKVIARELAAVRFDLDVGEINLSKLTARDLESIKSAIFQLVQSEAVEQAVWACAKKSLYNHQTIIPSMFDAESARQDYFLVAWEVVKVNLRPFFLGINWSSLGSADPTSDSLKSGPTSTSPS